MSLSLLNSTILRQKIASGFVTKGSSIAWLEEDDNWTIVVDAIRELANVPVDTTGFEEYNAGTTYENGDFVAYNGNIYQYINNVPSAGVTPGTDVLYWEISSQGQFAHERNKDTYLDLGGTYEVSAEDIYNLLNAGPLSLEWGAIEGTITDQTDLVNYTIHQGTNTQTEDLFLTGPFDIGLGTSTKEADTKFTFKSEGDDETTYLFRMLNDNDDLLLALQDDGNLVLPGSMAIGVYGSISETVSGLAYIIGNSVMASKTSANKLVKTTNDDGIAVRMRYDQGFSVHTGISGSLGTEVADDTNMRLQINQAGDLFLLMGSYHMADSEWFYFGGANFSTVGGLRMGQSGTDIVIQKNDVSLGWVTAGIIYTP